MLNLLGLLSKSASNVYACTSSDQNPSVCKVRLWHIKALKPANFLKIRIAADSAAFLDMAERSSLHFLARYNLSHACLA